MDSQPRAADAAALLPVDPAHATVADAREERDRLVQLLMSDPDRKPMRREWQEEVVYFLLPDRFNAEERPDLELPPPTATTDPKDQIDMRWDFWAISGRNRFQGGTIAGIEQKIVDGYLPALGVTCIWVGPVWKQRVAGVDRNVGRTDRQGLQPVDDDFPATESLPKGMHPKGARKLLCPYDDYHGYAIQDFLQVDPRFGTIDSLCSLVRTAHDHDIRVILDVMINHSGENWLYDSAPLDTLRPPYLDDNPAKGGYRPSIGTRYPFGQFLDEKNRPMRNRPSLNERDRGVWPEELQDHDVYHRRGFGSYRDQEDFKANTQFREADWMNRDFRYDGSVGSLINGMIGIWTYWMARTDCDGFRVDTFKHVPMETAARFTSCVRTFARKLGKEDFLVVGEVGGADADSSIYLHLDDRYTGHAYPNLRVRLLEVDARRNQLRMIAGGDPGAPTAENVLMPTLPNTLPQQHLSRLRIDVMTSIDDHDGLGTGTGTKRLAREYERTSVVPALGLLLFGPGIPCVYYGTEQALSGPRSTLLLNGYGPDDGRAGGDRYLREAMFGPRYPRHAGADGLQAGTAGIDPGLPGFAPGGPAGTSPTAADYFDRTSGTFLAAKALIGTRQRHKQLQLGDIELCLLATDSTPFALEPAAPVVAWTRSMRDKSGRWSALIVINNQKPGSSELTHNVQLPPYVDALELETEVAPAGPTAATARLAVHPAAQSLFMETTVTIGPSSVQVYLCPPPDPSREEAPDVTASL